MAIFDLFSKRAKKPPSELVYDDIPLGLRVQVVQIVRDTIDPLPHLFDVADHALNREHPISSFARELPRNFIDGTMPYAIQCILKGNFIECIDSIELLFAIINASVRTAHPRIFQSTPHRQEPDESIDELNGRLLEHGVGYQFAKEQGHIVKVASSLLHSEAVVPAMRLLSEPGFDGPAAEFADAHQQFRARRYKDALTAALRSLESTAKTICDQRGWPYDKNKTTVKPLLDILFANGLIPPDLESHFTGLRSALESGLPTLANRFARHGQGASVKSVSEHMVTFGMHLCAAAILFLVQAHQQTSKDA